MTRQTDWYSGVGITAVMLVMLLAPAKPPWRNQVPDLPTTTITVAGAALRVETARRPEAQQRGLGYRDGLATGTGMLFVFDELDEHTFWMKGMRFCLDIIWIGEGRVVGAAERICPARAGTGDPDIPRALSPEPVRYVLEVPAGWMEANEVTVGSAVEIHLPPPDTIADWPPGTPPRNRPERRPD